MTGKVIGGIVLVVLGMDMLLNTDLFRFMVPFILIGIGANIVWKNMKSE